MVEVVVVADVLDEVVLSRTRWSSWQWYISLLLTEGEFRVVVQFLETWFFIIAWVWVASQSGLQEVRFTRVLVDLAAWDALVVLIDAVLVVSWAWDSEGAICSVNIFLVQAAHTVRKFSPWAIGWWLILAWAWLCSHLVWSRSDAHASI